MALWMSICAGACASQNVLLGWQPATMGVAGYFVYSGSSRGSYTAKIDVGTNTTATISGLNEGQTNYFTVAAYNAAGIVSAPAQEIAYIVPGVIRLLPTSNPSNPISLTLPVAPGHWYEVQASSDLKSWRTIYQSQTVTSNAWMQVIDPQSGRFSRRYYRLILH